MRVDAGGRQRKVRAATKRQEAEAAFRARRLAPATAQLPDAFLLAGLLGRMMRDGERTAFVVSVLLVRVVDRLEEGFLLMLVVLVGLGLWQIGNVFVGHVGLPLDAWNLALAIAAHVISRRFRILDRLTMLVHAPYTEHAERKERNQFDREEQAIVIHQGSPEVGRRTARVS